ncbi:bile acid:sodium symporter family protein [Corynebacterium sp. sy039]|uniref:bile acid:sodium symporter family protein n=1 Tax=Corynebacterium sp. sy039 TaxID=2599641 RepID=UPI0011B6AD74|nr:bile acid:sodium symporter family protein [Corynebacterium sp. sy039]QDZ43645.1 bile acid:sodium symporter [Corynebacterium sp. sy039]
MLHWLKKLDPLIVIILSAVLIAIIFPAQGRFAELFSYGVKLSIALLFYLYGARLSTREALDGLKNWKLHLTVLSFTFVIFPLIGLGLQPLTHLLGSQLYLGILYLTLVPSTVQSSVAFTGMAKGNVAGAIVAASVSNLAGVVLTPLLVFLLMGNSNNGESVSIDISVFMDISLQLLVPFILGQLTRPWVARLAASKATKIVDRGSIAMVVYSAFSAGMVEHIWSAIAPWQIITLIIFSVLLVSFMLFLSKKIGALLRFNRKDTIAISFCGSKKSLASGLPIAAIIFPSTNLSILILPLMIFHQVQLIICSWLAGRYARE